MIKIAREHNATLVLVSVDASQTYPKLASFIKKKKWNSHVVWLNESDADYFCPAVDRRWSGSIPATVIIDKKNGRRAFIEEEMTESEFEIALTAFVADSK